MSDWLKRTMVVRSEIAEQASALASNIPSADGLWKCPLVSIMTNEITHYISHGLYKEEFVGLLPFVKWGKNEQNEYVVIYNQPGDSEQLLSLLDSLGVTVEPSIISFLFSMCDISDQEPDEVLDRLNLRFVIPDNTDEI